jgi:hypothetical protein
VTLLSGLVFGFLLGMRHATDADHVVAVATVVSHQRSVLRAAVMGSLWGMGHMLTLVLGGGAIIVFGLVVPPRLGLTFEFVVALMLVLLGLTTLIRLRRRPEKPRTEPAPHAHGHGIFSRLGGAQLIRPVVVGLIHGLAGSAAVALMVLATIREPLHGLAYLLTLGAGTIVGMLLITAVLAVPLRVAASRSSGLSRTFTYISAAASTALGLFLAYRIGFIDGLFSALPQWTPG